jgi:hypothetical protein
MAAGTERARPIMSEAFGQALADAGIIHDPDKVSRIVIDAQQGRAVMLYVERFGDERLLKVAQTLDGIEITSAPDGDGK